MALFYAKIARCSKRKNPKATARAEYSLVYCFQVDDRYPVVLLSSMPRRLRIEFEEAIDHVMARRHVRQRIIRDETDRRRLITRLGQALVRFSSDLIPSNSMK
jgi:hypothetical protein